MARLWLTYVELAEELGCDGEGARAIAAREKWLKRKSRDGYTRVLMPPSMVYWWVQRQYADAHRLKTTVGEDAPPSVAMAGFMRLRVEPSFTAECDLPSVLLTRTGQKPIDPSSNAT